MDAQGWMAQRRITDQEVQDILLCAEAEVTETYPTDKYSPISLICGVTALGRVLHVQSNHQGVIVTVYDPDPVEWIDLKRRKQA
jgi:hypothetical protein